MSKIIKTDTEVSYTPIEPTPISLIEKAINSNMDVEKLERLFDLQSRWEQQKALREFNEAFAQWTSNKPEIKKTKRVYYVSKTGQKTDYNYAPLPEIQKAVDSVLSSFGFSYRWQQHEESGKISITCILSHVGGHREQTTLTSQIDTSGGKNNIQGMGSAVTYMQRYTLTSILGVSAEDDNDGQTAPEPPKEAKEKPKAVMTDDIKNKAIKAIQEGKKGVFAACEKTYQMTMKQHDEILNTELNYEK